MVFIFFIFCVLKVGISSSLTLNYKCLQRMIIGLEIIILVIYIKYFLYKFKFSRGNLYNVAVIPYIISSNNFSLISYLLCVFLSLVVSCDSFFQKKNCFLIYNTNLLQWRHCLCNHSYLFDSLQWLFCGSIHKAWKWKWT